MARRLDTCIHIEDATSVGSGQDVNGTQMGVEWGAKRDMWVLGGFKTSDDTSPTTAWRRQACNPITAPSLSLASCLPHFPILSHTHPCGGCPHDGPEAPGMGMPGPPGIWPYGPGGMALSGMGGGRQRTLDCSCTLLPKRP